MLSTETNSLVTSDFNSGYFDLHNLVFTKGETVPSRNGVTKEILNFKTTITKPANKCVGGYKRNVNIFFLMAESLWIFNGRRDLEFLEIFNSQMREYSDDGISFNGAYGWRMRKYDTNSFTAMNPKSVNQIQNSRDQLAENLELLHQDPGTRQSVISLWNPSFDGPEFKTKDRCCNSMLMFKIRNNQLHQTIQNRSNDLDWGLTTNVYQFGFLGEAMAALLGVQYGSQTHNSQSLHLYIQQDLTTDIQSRFTTNDKHQWGEPYRFYQILNNIPIEFQFEEPNLDMTKKLFWVDFYIHSIILRLLRFHKEELNTRNNEEEENDFSTKLKQFSYYLWVNYQLLRQFIFYKRHKDHETALGMLTSFIRDTGTIKIDLCVLSINWFLRRIKDKDNQKYLELYDQLTGFFPSYRGIAIGRL
jgi:thymidylate synthase